MILILTTKSYEQCTGPVLDWLLYKEQPFVVLNFEDLLTKKIKYLVDIEKGDILIDGISIKEKIKVIWYRRFHIENQLFKVGSDTVLSQLHSEMESEIETFLTYLWHLFKDKLKVPEMPQYGENKIIFLDFAARAGLDYPKTIITNNKKELKSFFKNCQEKVISKPLYFSEYFIKENMTLSIYTTTYTEDMIESLPDFFPPTLFQKKIEAIHEIRVFYLSGQCYSTAAVVTDKNKKVDIKLNYKSEQIHWIPYKLPFSIEVKIKEFMDSINLSTGSLDILKTKTGFVFIEVNPVGQFLAPSSYCNYYLEKEIADFLSHKLIKE
ncbi:hypothetical protein CMT75_17720 [Elizabethkingia anophelis]|nr:hypothetical protein [Elizabethkingia anophelis]